MADSFDVLDIVFKAAEKANTGLVQYKNKSKTAEKQNHIVVSMPALEGKDYVNKTPFLNVNVFVKNLENGMVDNQTMKEAIRALVLCLNNIEHPIGMYFKCKIVWVQSMGEYKEGFECMNIRLEVITEIN